MATVINALEIPVSTIQSATAASYVVPADRYAIAKVHVRATGTISINGTTVLDSISNTWSAIASNSSPVTLTGPGAASLSTPSGDGNAAGGRFQYLPNAPGSGSNYQLFTPATSTSFSTATTFTNSTGTQHTSDSAEYKLPPGTTIVGSGIARYHIELYRIPGSAT